jgi:glucokinase
MADGGFIGAIDLGGTKILSVVVDGEMRVVSRDQRPTEAHEESPAGEFGPGHVIQRMVESMRAAAAGRRLDAVGISSPGPLNPVTGVVSSASNLPGWRNVPVTRLMSEGLGVPVWLEHDAKAAAIAEHRLGAGRGASNLVLMALGTGIGAGLILDGRVYRGTSGAAGEIGHTRIVEDGPRCSCGRTGCLEALASGWSLARDAAALIEREPDGILARMSRDEDELPSARTLERAAGAGDASAAGAIRAAGRHLGAGLVNVVNVFNPQVIAISGNLRKLEGYLSVALEVVEREAFRQTFADVRIVETAVGDDASALGAALVAHDGLAGH